MTLNPNWPDVEWKVYTGENPPAAPNTPTTTPTDISGRVKAMSISRGRQYELDQDEAGVATAVVDNDDGTLTANPAAGRIPMRFGTCTARWAGTTYPLFTGFVQSWPNKAVDPATGVAELSFVDLFDVLANYPMQSAVRQVIQSASVAPTLYYPLSDAVGAAGAGNIVPGTAWPLAPFVDFKGGGVGTMKFGGAAFLPSNSDTTLTNDNTTGPSGKATQVQISGPMMHTGPTIDTTQPWMASIYVQATGGRSVVFSMLDRSGNVFAYIKFDAIAGSITTYTNGNYYVYSGTQGSTTVSALLARGVQVAVGYDGANGFGYLDGGNHQTWVYAAAGTIGWIAAGMSFNGTTIYGSSNGTFSLAHLAIWSGGSIPNGTDVANMGEVGDPGFGGGEGADGRTTRVLGWAGQGGLAGDVDTLFLGPYQDTKGTAALDLIRQSAFDASGRFFINESGLPEYHNKDHGQTLTAPQYVFGSNTGAGELPYTGGPGFEFDTQHIYNDVQVTRTGGAVQRWTNPASIAKYFTRVLQLTVNTLKDVDAGYRAQFLANRYAEPDQRIGDIVLESSANPALWPCVLAISLDDVVQVNHRDVNGTTTGLFQVAKIHHDVVGGESWQTTLSLAPFHQYWLLAAMHTTMRASCLAGATSISINPLTDVATNCAEASIGVGTTITLDPGTGAAETVTITSVTSAPTPRIAGYTSITLGITATAHAHAAGAVACDPLPAGVTDPTKWDARSVLGSTTTITY